MQHATEQEQLWIIRYSFEPAVADAIASEKQLLISGCYWKTGRWNCGSAQLWIAWCNNEPPGATVSNGESADVNVNQQMCDCDHQRQPWASRYYWEPEKMQLRYSRCNSKTLRFNNESADATICLQIQLWISRCWCTLWTIKYNCEPPNKNVTHLMPYESADALWASRCNSESVNATASHQIQL
jgi:hypothetical protein